VHIYTNSSSKNIVRNAFYNNLQGVTDVFIASPFFSYSDLVEEILKKGCFVRLIIKLGPATTPSALQRLINQKNIHIRYFTSPAFHSKLYIFGDNVSLVGSANLTQSGMNTNSEICVEIPREDEAFDNLLLLFQSYWNQATPLDQTLLDNYSKLFDTYSNKAENSFEKNVKDQFGDVVPASGIAEKPKPSKEQIYLSGYQRTYQEFLTAFAEVKEIYQSDSRRQQPEEILPLRIEIDLFLSYVRENFTKGDSYKDEPFRNGDDRKSFVKSRLEKWFGERHSYLDDKVPLLIPRIQRLFSVESIEKSTLNEIIDALDVCHSFHDRLRFFEGGHDKHIEVFMKGNDFKQIKKVILYLLHGKDNYVTRMGNCIFAPEYKLNQFGRSGVQELLGWVNKEEIPICNGRTVKALRYLGYKVAIFA